GIGIFLLPIVFSWFTLRKGHSAVARVVSLVWLAVFFILAGREDADEEQKLASISQEPSPRMVASSEPERAPPSEGARAPSDKSPRQAPVQAPEPKPAFALNEKEQTILRELMLEDIENFADGGDSVFGVSRDESTPVVVSADALQREYERNEVAADQKFRHKMIILN